MSSANRSMPLNPPLFILRVSEFTVSSQVAAPIDAPFPVEFTLAGRVGAGDPEAEMECSGEPHPLVGRRLSVLIAGGERCRENGMLGWIQFAPNAPDITAAARIECCPRRAASLRATAHHATGPHGGRLELILDVAPALDSDVGTVVRIPIRDATIRATRCFEALTAPAGQIAKLSASDETSAVLETEETR